MSADIRRIEEALVRAVKAQSEAQTIRTDRFGERFAYFDIGYGTDGEPFARVSLSKIAEVLESELA